MNREELGNYLDTRDQIIREGYVGVNSGLDSKLWQLHRHERTLHTLAETACNRDMTEHEVRREQLVKSRVQNIVKDLGSNFGVRFNGDPRGSAIRLLLPSGRSNNWDGETWGIYF